MSDKQSPTENYAELAGKRDTAQRRVEELEAEQRQAAQAHQQARAALVEAERKGARPAELRKLEEALTAAEAKPKVLGARIEGARHAVRDADVALARFVQQNLTELVEPLEEDGRIAAGNLNAAAEALIAAYHERERVASRITGLAAMTGRPRPGDVSRTRAEQAVRAASDLIAAGGEVPPTLDRDPRQPRHGELAEAAS